jgi:hypothetical protein
VVAAIDLGFPAAREFRFAPTDGTPIPLSPVKNDHRVEAPTIGRLVAHGGPWTLVRHELEQEHMSDVKGASWGSGQRHDVQLGRDGTGERPGALSPATVPVLTPADDEAGDTFAPPYPQQNLTPTDICHLTPLPPPR